jgi:hypothetical protein
MKAGGFQCILGNPPYVRIQAMKQWAPWEVDIYRELFETGKAGNYDIYVVFIERALKLLHPRGQLGFICPHKFFNSRYGQPLRAIIARGRHLSHVVHFGSQQVFPRATTYSCLLFLTSAPVSQFRFTKVDDLHAWRTAGAATEGLVEASAVAAGPWNFAVGRGAALFAKLAAMPCKLGDVAEVFVGLQTSADDVYILDFVGQSERTYRLRSKSLGQEWTLEKDLVHPLVSGTDVSRYGPLGNRQYIVFPYAVEEGRASLLDFEILKRDWPQTAAYLLENKKRLEGREKGRMQGPLWHGYVYRKNMARQSLVKLCVPRLVGQLHAAYDRDGSHFLDNVDVGGVRWKPPHAGQGLEYLLALLNCRLMRWYFPQVSASFRGGWRSANRQFLALLPIRVIDGNSTKDAAIHRQLVGLAGAVQTLHAELAAATSAGVTGALRRKIDATDAEIDRLVYDLYGLTGEEIAVVEGESARVPLAAVKE